MKILLKRSLPVFLVFIFFTTGCGNAKNNQLVEQKKDQLIGYVLDKELPAVHFSHKQMDSSLTMAAFDLYLKQLDYQKRFLLSGDVTVLRSFTPHIGNNLENGTNFLPETGYKIIKERIGQVEKIVDQIMAVGFDVKRHDIFETDPKKITFVDELKGLQDRWRMIMKYQIIYKYLDLVDDQEKAKDKLSDAEMWEQAKEKVTKINKDFFFRLHQETLQDHYDRFFNAIAMAFDPHTNYLPPSQKEELDIQLRGNLEGVGALLREDNGFIKVTSLISGGPAAQQGMLQPEDTLLQVSEKGADPVDITNMRLRDAVKLIRGPKGTEVRLTVKKPNGTMVVIPIIRAVVQVEDTLVKDTVIAAPDGGKIGYILLPSFYRDFDKTKNDAESRNAADDTRKAIKDLKKTNIEGIILDLRNDGGGSLLDAVEIAGLFIKSGPIVQVKDSSGTIKALDDDDDSIEYSGSLVVLVNQFSASASEIVAAALQDYKRAIIVGSEQTYGKGTVQSIIDINKIIQATQSEEFGDLGALKVTIQKFYRITGGSTQYKGVIPDIILPSLFQHLQSGEKYLDYSLPWDQIGPAKYTPFRGKSLDLDMIRKRSLQRVEHDPELQAIAKEAVKADEQSKETAVSLLLTDMRQKIEEARVERKKLGDQYSNYPPGLYNDEQLESDGKDTNKNNAADWKERINQDPYVGEAKNIIIDMQR